MGLIVGFTDHHVQHYRDHGYAIIENFLDANELESARDEIDLFIPGWLRYAANPKGEKPEGWNEPPRSRRTMRFPFKGSQLNAITLHPELRRFASIFAESDDLFCEQSDLHYKCKGHYADADQVMHLDYMNHTLAYPPNLPDYWQTAFYLQTYYL